MSQSKICRTLKFSHRAVENLAPPAPDAASSNIEYSDACEPNLRIAVYKSGKRSFRHRYTFLGQKKMMTLGEFPAVTVDKARERVRRNKALLADDLDPLEERERRRQAITFAEFVENHFIPYARKERRSCRDIENRIKLRLIPAFGKKHLPRISKRDVAELHIKLRDEISAVTANRYLATLGGMFTKAIEWGWMTENPCRGIKKYREGGGRKRVLAGDELVRFMKALKEETTSLPGKAIFILIALGLRKMEVLSLRWSNVYLEEKRLYLPFTKSGRPRFVAINSQALQLLTEMSKERREGCDWVFPSTSHLGHLMEVRRTFETITKKAGITGLKLHDLRRSYASILVNAGVSIYEIRDLLGHSDVRTTQVYAHLDTSTLQNATETAASELEKAMAAM